MKILITSGGTKEPIDPVRYIGNRSSGKMGQALHAAALNAGHEVIFLDASEGTAAELYEKVLAEFEEVDVVIMSAAVADYTPVEVAEQKIKKSNANLVIELQPTVDILKELGKRKTHQFLVGFCLESENLVEEAQRKLREKKLDMVVGNGVEALGADISTAVIVSKNGHLDLPSMSKSELAEKIITWLNITRH
jgi:phosphopantothenoylcysteine decarboxylase/phosphopantothenate--cysteine ligase